MVLYTIEGGGHTWPGGPGVGLLVGRVSREIDATQAIWEFFAAFSFFALAALDLAHRLREQRRGRSVSSTRAPALAGWRDGDAAREIQRAG